MESKRVAYIIPLHKKDDRVFKAIESIYFENAVVIVSIPKELKTWLHKGLNKLKEGVFSAVGDRGSSYPTLVNMGLDVALGSDVENIDYISILEFDDVLTPNAHKILNKYANDWEDVDILAPLACVVKWIDGDDKPVLVGTANEAPMAPQIAEEFGFFDFNMMLKTNFMFVNGLYIKPEVFKQFGRFKENFEMFYDYEWALRMVYNGVTIRSIPKATHLHSLSEDGAFETQKNADSKTRDNWLSAARREYFFEDDRNISFN